MIVAVREGGEPLPPCGRCRELIQQVHPDNGETLVLLSRDRAVPLRELLPTPWTPQGGLSALEAKEADEADGE
jgi:cytidine deaminase